MGRPFTKLPPGARAHLEAMAASGTLTESKAADALGMPLTQFRRVIVDDAGSASIWRDALAVERDQLLGALYDKAIQGDTKAATTLLAVRHGLSEKGSQSGGEPVQVVFNLPDSMPAEKYINALGQRPQVGNDAG